ncbi:MAG: hypothetical protein IJ282_04995 [Lachnospiraceae bacterium]|nr:hypothetical protein [Lachnospiraceae bacterium]
MKRFLVKISCIAVLIAGLMGITLSGVHALDEETAQWVEEARLALKDVTDGKVVMALVYLSDEYPIRLEPSQNSAVVQTVRSGQQVQIKDVFVDDNYEVWSYVSFYYDGQLLSGYVPRTMLACSDQDFLTWEDTYGMNPASRSMYTLGADGEAVYADVEAFPESYKEALLELKKAHPNWNFVKMDTGLDWNGVINAQMQGGRSLVPDSYPEYMKEGVYGAGWSYAAKNILEYHMDPRNFLQESTIFQFELLTYNETYHTQNAVQKFLDNTFMSGKGPGTVMSYAQIFWANGMDMNVSPFHLACRVYQEQGQGTSPLISGTYPGYEGLYNYFNIKASGKTQEEIIINGLTYAKNAMDVDNPNLKQPWNSAYYSIRGGANIIAANYILKGQDTLYLQKFNVDKNSSYGVHNHQYMQNIVAPTSEGKNIKKLYTNANSLDNTFVFKIPVFNNMPEAKAPYPTESYDVILEAPEGYEDATIYLDGVAYVAEERNGNYVVTAPNGEAKTAVMYKYNDKGVPVGMYCWTLSYSSSKGAYTVTALPGLEDLLSYHGFAIRITGISGIRFKTGISKEMRETLLGNGVDGYKLKEYGTMAMKNVNYPTYPFILGGQKILTGRAYGIKPDGSLQDDIWETVDGRYRYTSVLTNLPAKEYEQKYAFRGYIVLTKNGQDVVFYGPVMAKSIYEIAEILLANNVYQEGSSAKLFLEKIISDADALKEEQPGGGSGNVSGGDAAGGGNGAVSGGDATGENGNVSGGDANSV